MFIPSPSVFGWCDANDYQSKHQTRHHIECIFGEWYSHAKERSKIMLTQEDYDKYAAIYDDVAMEKTCMDYLVASVMIEQAIIDRNHTGDPSKKRKPEPEKALAILLVEEQVFLNTNWFKENWPDDAKKTTVLYANCNDVFAWGCADAESVEYDEIVDVFEHWMKDPDWGVAVWCIKKCNMMPQPPVERLIRRAGIWNLDEMGLRESPFKKDWSEESLNKRYGKLPETTEQKDNTDENPA